MRQLAEDRGFDYEELMGGKKKGRKRAAPKYQNPDNLKQTWSGMGRHCMLTTGGRVHRLGRHRQALPPTPKCINLQGLLSYALLSKLERFLLPQAAKYAAACGRVLRVVRDV